MGSRTASVLAPALAGAVLLAWPAFHLAADVQGASAVIWPPLFTVMGHGAIYLIALALMMFAWWRSQELELPLSRVLLLGALVHAVALASPPFLSVDTLFYTAIGRAMQHGASPSVAVDAVLPGGDPLLPLLPETWRHGNSPYLFGWNQLSHLVVMLSGGSLRLSLKLFQLIGMLSSLAAAALIGRAAGPRAAALVIFSPLAIVEATHSGHNDALIMVAVAAYAALTLRRPPPAGPSVETSAARHPWAVPALAAGLLIKATAALPLLIAVTAPVFARTRRLLTPLRVLAVGALCAAAFISLWLFLLPRFPMLRTYSAMVGDPSDHYEHCTRSWECLPRATLRYALDWKVAAWTVGLVFRAGSMVWLLYAAARATRDDNPLAWMAKGLFVYFLFMHGWMMSWYLLIWLPLMPFAAPHIRRAMFFHAACALGYYAANLCFQCYPALGAERELIEAVIASGIPGLYYVIAEARASSGNQRRAA